MPLASISISANRSGQTNFVDNIGEPIVLKILSEILRRYHLTRKGFDPDKISLSDEISNRLAINLPHPRVSSSILDVLCTQTTSQYYSR